MSVEERVKEVISQTVGAKIDELQLDTDLNEFGLDSLDVTEMAMELEEEFDINIPDDVVDKVRTVGDVVKIVEERGVV